MFASAGCAAGGGLLHSSLRLGAVLVVPPVLPSATIGLAPGPDGFPSKPSDASFLHVVVQVVPIDCLVVVSIWTVLISSDVCEGAR